MAHVWSFFLNHKRFSYLILVGLLIVGSYSIQSIPKESSPEVQIPVGIVSTALPGASAEDVETLITDVIERQLRGSLEGLTTLTSTSREGSSNITAEFSSDTDLDAAIDELKTVVDRAAIDLPDEATEPRVSDIDFVDQPVIQAAVASDRTASAFAELAEGVEDALLSTSGVSDVSIGGKRERQVRVIVEQNALAGFGLTLSDVTNAIRGANASAPAGAIEFDGAKYNVELTGDITHPNELSNIAVGYKNGTPVYLRDVAFIANTIAEETSRSRVSEHGNPAQPALSFGVTKQTGGNIAAVAENVRGTFATLQENGALLADSTVTIVQDLGELVAKDLRDLSLTGSQTIALVMLLLFITIGWREAIVAGLAIPLSFLIAFIGLNASGNTLNFVSLFSLILSIGILVDSAIVMVEAIHTKMKNWMDKNEAARSAIAEYHAPLTAGTLTTVAVFAPLFIVSGVTGEFIASIPFTIIFVLLASLVVAIGIIPLIASTFLRRRTTSTLERYQEIYTEKLQSWYRGVLGKLVGNSRREKGFFWGVIGAFVLALALPIFGLVPTIFFPQEDIDFLTVQIEEPIGTNLDTTDLETRKIEEVLYEIPEIESFLTTVGQSTGDFGATSGTRLASIVVTLYEDRDRTSSQVVNDLRERFSSITSTDVSVSQPNNGPPTGDPVQIRFLGDDLEELSVVTNSATQLLRDIPGTTQVEASTDNVGTEINVSIDRARAAAAGVSMQVLTQTVRTALHGTDATTIRDAGEETDVVVVANLNPDYKNAHDTNTITPTALAQIDIPAQGGRSVSLGSISDITLERQSTVINHRDRKRVESVSSQVTGEASALAVTSAFFDRQNELNVPESVTIETGGETQESQESFQEMFIALIVGLLAMFGLLVFQFDSFRYALYVLSVIPFALIGIFFGFAITGTAISFPSMMGFIALAGIVVNNSIILMDRMRRIQADNPAQSSAEVAIEAATQRLRPILLTTITTVIGVSPLLFAAALWAPLAQAIMFGLLFAVVLTLFFVPVLYARWPGKQVHNAYEQATQEHGDTQ